MDDQRAKPWAAVAVLVIGLLSSACSSPVATSDAPTEPAPSASPTPEPTRRPVPTAGAFDGQLVTGLRTETDVPFTESLPCGSRECVVPLDVLAPEAGEALPTIVLLPGGPSAFHERRYLEALAAAAAQRGAVVFLATYRSPATTNSIDDSLHDVRCAIRFARLATADYGGDPDLVVLVGHSYGSELALRTAAEAATDSPGCLADGNGVPDAFVGLAGFNVTISGTPDVQPPVLLISGSDDRAAGFGGSAAADLRDAGFEADYVQLEGIDHFEIVAPDIAPSVIDLIFEVISMAGAGEPSPKPPA
jgi:acetyl esterase/lipase